MTNNFDLETIYGATIYDQDNEKVGAIKDVYLDDRTAEPRFATVSTGLFGMKQTFVPLDAARASGEGNLTVPFTKDFIKDAPNIDPDGHLDPSEERRIFEHYGAEGTTPSAPAPDQTAADGGGQQAAAHEERLNVGKQDHVAGRARLRKRVVSERQQVEVPVEREELVVEREKIDPNSGEAQTGSLDDAAGSDETITLHEERPVVEKETVATERVNVDKRKVTDTETVTGDVRKEEIDVDADDVARGRHGKNGSRTADYHPSSEIADADVSFE